MSEPSSPRSGTLQALAKLGVAAGALAVFTCGWLAMSATDWRRILLFTGLALVSGAVASAFSRAAR